MATAKTWTYAELTAKAERDIRSNRRLAAEAAAASSRNDYFVMAMGVFHFWNEVTMDWQKEGDADRLRGIAEGIR